MNENATHGIDRLLLCLASNRVCRLCHHDTGTAATLKTHELCAFEMSVVPDEDIETGVCWQVVRHCQHVRVNRILLCLGQM